MVIRYIIIMITVHVIVYKVYLVLLMVSLNIFYNCGGA